jgi:hypothetical protein
MGREIYLVRGDVVVWSGVIEGTEGGEVRSVREYFDEAWQRALSEGAVIAEDAGTVQFRSTAPE